MIIDKLRKQKKTILFLDVLDTNESAVSFYEKLGFKFHSKTKVGDEHFKEELNGLNRNEWICNRCWYIHQRIN